MAAKNHSDAMNGSKKKRKWIMTCRWMIVWLMLLVALLAVPQIASACRNTVPPCPCEWTDADWFRFI